MKKSVLISLSACMLAALAACHTNNAGNTEPDTSNMIGDTINKGLSPNGNDPDAAFARQAAAGGAAELALSKMALAKAVAPQIKTFADMMIVDHTRMSGELSNLAKSKGITFTATPDARHRQIADSLSKLSGTAFDKGFAQVMVTDHKATLALLQQEAQNSKDAGLKTFATKFAPIVQAHLDSIQKIQAAIK